MLCLMFESSRRGYLQQANGQPLSLTQLARMTGCATDEAAHLVQELEDAGVCSRTEHGTIYSRRLVREEHAREQGRNRVNKFREKERYITQGVTHDVTPMKHPSSSSSSSSKLNTAQARFEPGLQNTKTDYDATAALEFWKRKKDRGDADYKDAPNWVRKELDK